VYIDGGMLKIEILDGGEVFWEKEDRRKED
jgi:hypothetical protein